MNWTAFWKIVKRNLESCLDRIEKMDLDKEDR